MNLYREKIFRLIIILFATLVFFERVNAQTIPFSHISVEDGLSNSFVNCLLQDRTGFIWFGTDDGLNRFDGYDIKVYRNDPDDKSSLSENIIWALHEDRSGHIWIGTKSGGLNRYNLHSNKFDHWQIDSSSNSEINITYIYEDSKKNIWIGTYRNGIYRFDPSQNKFDHWQNYLNEKNTLSNNYIISVIEDKNSNIWIGTYNGLNKFNPEQPDNPFTQYVTISQNPIWYLASSSFEENVLWIGTLEGLIKFDIISEKFSKIDLPESKALQFGNSVSSIAEELSSDEKILWIGTYGGLVRYNITTSHKERFIQIKNNPKGLASDQISDIIIDRSGVIWIATDNGLNSYSPKRSKFNQSNLGLSVSNLIPELLYNDIKVITQTDDKSLWFGTDAGLFRIKNTSGKTSCIQNQQLQSLNVWSLFSKSSDRLWIGTYGQGLMEFNLKNNKLKKWEIANPYLKSSFAYVKTILEDDDGMLWIGFWGSGLARLNTVNGKIDYWKNETGNPASLSYNDIWAIHQDKKGRIWIGTNGGGLDLFNKEENNGFYHWNTINKNNQKLSSNNIFTICPEINGSKSDDQTILWIGTANGLNKFVINDDPGIIDGLMLDIEIKYYLVEDGLPDNTIESILEDENGNLWIGTSSGLSFFETQKEVFTNFTTEDGLNGSSYNSSASLKTYDGIMFFGSTTGLTFFEPGKIKQSSFSQPVIITDFQILNQPADLTDTSFTSDIFNSKKVVLSYDQNDFSFQFASLDYNAPDMNQYLYFMEGFDRDWIYSGKRRFVTYTNLDPGEYIFRVKATNSDGVWNQNVASLQIMIKPPFWATWWFRTIMILCLFSIGPIIYYRRVNALQKEKLIQVEFSKQLIQSQEEERKRIASELHDSLGQDLLVIKNLALMNKDKNEHFDEISRTTSFAIDDVRRIAYNLHPYQLDRLGLTKAISSMFLNIEGVSEIKFDNEIENVDGIFEKEKEINIYRIIQEGVNNIIKHSGADKARIKVQKLNGNLHVEIADNGKGFNLEIVRSESKGFGLKNLENRVSFLGGEIQFISNNEFATIVKIKIPMGVRGKD